MNLQTARLLMPLESRQDRTQDRLTWLPKELYEQPPVPTSQERS